MRWLTVLLIGGLVLAVSGPAWGLSFLQPYSGPILMKFSNWDEGRVYAPVDGSGNRIDGTWTTETTLNGLATVAGHPIGAKGTEDSWGVFRLTGIYTPDGITELWIASTSSTEITGIFWGERDTYLQVVNAGLSTETQYIHGVGLSAAFFEGPKNADPYPATGIAAERTAPGAFTTMTDGTLIWTFNSVPGWDTVYPTDEFFTEFHPSASWTGSTADGGFLGQVGDVDLDGDGTASDAGSLNYLIVPSGYGTGIDASFSFTGKPDPNGKWLVKSDDPVLTTIIPEPVTMASLFLGIGCLSRYIRKRR